MWKWQKQRDPSGSEHMESHMPNTTKSLIQSQWPNPPIGFLLGNTTTSLFLILHHTLSLRSTITKYIMSSLKLLNPKSNLYSKFNSLYYSLSSKFLIQFSYSIVTCEGLVLHRLKELILFNSFFLFRSLLTIQGVS